MTINAPAINFDLWQAFVNDVPFTIDDAAWQSDTVLRIGVTHTPSPGDVLKVRLPVPDALVFDENGDICLGFPAVSDVWPAALGPIFDSWDQEKPNVS